MSVALVYVRQSRTEPGSISLEVQEERCRAIPEVAACDSIEVYRDEDVSGGTERREAYQRFMHRIEQARNLPLNSEEGFVVAAYDLSRISRDAEVLLRFHRLVASKPIKVKFADGMKFGVSAVEKAMFGTVSIFSELQRQQTAEKIRDAYASLNAKGQATGMPPYGYRRQGKQFVIHEEEAAVVRRIFEEYSQGHLTTRELSARLNEEGIVKPRSRSKGLGWVPDTLVDILGNLAYVGKTYSISRARRQGDIIPAAWQPIVSEELFAAAQRALALHSFGGRQGPRLKVYTFSRLLVCSQCHRTMRGKKNHGIDYYMCRDDVAVDEQCPGAHHAIREDRLLPWADELFERLDAIAPKRPNFTNTVSEIPQPPTEALAQIEARMTRLTNAYVTFGHISEQEYLSHRQGLEARRAELANFSKEKITIRLQGLHDAWRKGNPAERRSLLRLLFDGLVVENDRIVAWTPRADREAEVIGIMELVRAATSAVQAVPSQPLTSLPSRQCHVSGHG